MQQYNPDFDLDRFFIKLAAAQHSLLMLDYDGTLAPFKVKRNEALPYPGVIEQLEALIACPRVRLVIISGRIPEELNQLLNIDAGVELFACHGAVRQSPDGHRESFPLTDDVKKLLQEIKSWGETNSLDEHMEFKSVSVAFHWRGLPKSRADDIREAIERKWSVIVSDSGLSLLSFDGGIELRPKGIDKGTAVRAIMSETATDIPVAYLGDDITDEDAFRELGNRGLKLLVRTESRPTLADYRVTPPEELLEFLNNWIEAKR